MLKHHSAKAFGMVLTLAASCLTQSMVAASVPLPIADCGSEISRRQNADRPRSREVDAVLKQASIQMSTQDYGDAIRTIAPVACFLIDPRVSLLLAAALEGSGDTKGAERALQRAHTVWPLNNSIATSLARIYIASGQSEKAALALSTSHVDATTPLQELELRVEVDLAVDRLLEAQHVADLAEKAYPSEETIILFANVLQVQGRSHDALNLLREKQNLYADSPGFQITFAESQYDMGDYRAAQEALSRAIALQKDSYLAHYILGNVSMRLGNIPQAIAEYRSAIALAPKKPRTYYQLAQALTASSDDAGADQALKDALDVDSHYAPAQCEIGRRLMEQSRVAEAIAYFTQAIQDNPTFETPYYLLSLAYARLGERSESRTALNHFLAVKDSNKKRARSGTSTEGLESKDETAR